MMDFGSKCLLTVVAVLGLYTSFQSVGASSRWIYLQAALALLTWFYSRSLKVSAFTTDNVPRCNSHLDLSGLADDVDTELQLKRRKAREIDEIISERRFTPQWVLRTLFSSRRETLLRLLVECSANRDLLNYILLHVNVGQLLLVAGDAVVSLLQSSEVIGRLQIVSKAAVLHGLHTAGVASTPQGEELVRAILLATRAGELSALKNLVDHAGGGTSIFHLVYHCLRDARQTDVLKHIKHQQDNWLMEAPLSAPTLRMSASYQHLLLLNPSPQAKDGGGADLGPLKMLCSYSAFTTPTRRVCPGALGFFEMLELAGCGEAQFGPRQLGNLVLLSQTATEKSSYKLLHGLHADGRVHTMPTVLPTDVPHKRASLCARFMALYPEYRYVFVGDARCDARAAQHLINHSSPPGSPSAASPGGVAPDEAQRPLLVLLHVAPGSVPSDSARAGEEEGVCHFSTFVGAALHAHDKRLLKDTAILEILRLALSDATEELKAPLNSTSLCHEHEDLRAALAADVLAAERVLPRTQWGHLPGAAELLEFVESRR